MTTRLLILTLAIASALQTSTIYVRRPKAAAGCTTPTGSILTESFGDASTSCWTSGPTTCNNTWTVNSGAVAIATSPAGSDTNTACTNSIQIDETGTEINIYRSITSTAVHDIIFELYVASENIANTGVYKIMGVEGSGTVAQIRLTKSGSQLQILASATTDSTPINISVSTWYHVTLHLDTTLANSSLTVGGTTQTFTRANVSTTSIWLSGDNLYLTGNVNYYIGFLTSGI